MGYRSDVTISLYVRHNTPFPVLKLWFDENFPHQEARDEWGAEVETDEETYINVWYTDVKWYDNYGHPSAVREAFNQFNATFDGGELDTAKLAYEFVRIGEENQDIEHEGSQAHDYRLGVNRSIQFT